jgi:hypothetical protein
MEYIIRIHSGHFISHNKSYTNSIVEVRTTDLPLPAQINLCTLEFSKSDSKRKLQYLHSRSDMTGY